MDIRLGKLLFSASAALFCAAVYFFGGLNTLFTLVVCVAIHELGHWAAIRLLGGRVTGVRVSALGVVMDATPLTYGRELAAALAGPAAGFLLCAAASRLGNLSDCDTLLDLSGVSAVFSMFNLIPVLPLDGGRALLSCFACLFDIYTAERLSAIFGGAAILTITAGGVLLFLRGGGAWMCFCGVWLAIAYCKRLGFSIKSKPQYLFGCEQNGR